MNLLALFGRLLMSAIFIQGGITKAFAPSVTIAMIERNGLPLPQVGWAVAVVIELVGGLMFLVGFRARPVALILALWCILTALVVHLHPGDRAQMIHFMKNVCMAGGFLQVAAFGAGRFRFGRDT